MIKEALRRFVNLLVAVTAEGRPEQWRLELDNRRELTNVGFTADTFKHGDRIVVTGNPAQREPSSLYVRRLDRPADGFWYEQVGASPRTSVGT